jgi:hypothetical protein
MARLNLTLFGGFRAQLDGSALMDPVRNLVGDRIERLADPSRRLAAVAAVIGGPSTSRSSTARRASARRRPRSSAGEIRIHYEGEPQWRSG